MYLIIFIILVTLVSVLIAKYNNEAMFPVGLVSFAASITIALFITYFVFNNITPETKKIYQKPQYLENGKIYIDGKIIDKYNTTKDMSHQQIKNRKSPWILFSIDEIDYYINIDYLKENIEN